jgi:hypothetical protein
MNMESELGLRARLAVSQPRKWLGIAEQEVALNARFVIALETGCSAIEVGAEQDRRAVRRGLDDHDDTDVALALHIVDHLGVEDNPLIPRRDLYKARYIRPRHCAVIRLRAAGTGTWRTIIEGAEVGIATPLADLLEPEGLEPGKAWLCAVIALGHHVTERGEGRLLDDPCPLVQIDSNAGELLGRSGACRRRRCNPARVGAMVRHIKPAQGGDF